MTSRSPTSRARHTPCLPAGSGGYCGTSASWKSASWTAAAQKRLLDARPNPRFRGKTETIDPVAGHIPGAISAPANDNVDSSGRFLPADELASRFRQRFGVSGMKNVGTYCGSGIQATHLALALSVAGITDSADVYIGSWSDWITDPSRPVEI